MIDPTEQELAAGRVYQASKAMNEALKAAHLLGVTTDIEVIDWHDGERNIGNHVFVQFFKKRERLRAVWAEPSSESVGKP